MQATDVYSSLQKHIFADGYRQVPDFEKSHGSYLVDLRDGQEYLDFCNYYASLPLSYDASCTTGKFIDDIVRHCRFKPANCDFYTVPFAEFIEALASVLPEQLRSHIFYIDTGGLANENAMKAAFDWKTRKNLQKGVEIEADKMIYFERAFHGRNGYALSCTNSPHKAKTMYFPRFDFYMVNPAPVLTQEDDSDNDRKVDAMAADIRAYCAANKYRVAGLIVEPMQGEGGDRHFSRYFFTTLRKLADECEFMLIFDEVQTGMGASGKWWTHQHFDVTPDMMSFGKKTQICGFAAGPRIDEVEGNCFQVSSRISATWCGNVLDFIRGAYYIRAIRDNNYVENAAVQGEWLLAEIRKLAEEYACVTHPRGLGLLCAFDLPDTESRDRFISYAMSEEHLIMLGCGTRSIRFRPVLDVKREELEEGFRRIRRCLQAVCNDGSLDMSKHSVKSRQSK